MLLVDLNYNFEFDWFVELSDNKLLIGLLNCPTISCRITNCPITT